MGKKQKKNEMDDSTKQGPRVFYGLLESLAKMWNQEVNSLPGRFNLFIDCILAAIIGLYILNSTITSVARIVASIWNPALSEQTGDNIISVILSFIIPSGLCLLFMYVIQLEQSKREQRDEDPIELESMNDTNT